MYQILDSNSTIKIDLPNIDKNKLDKIKNCFVRLLDSKFFEMDTGSITLHFSNGDLKEVWLKVKLWKGKTLDKPVG